MSFRVDKNLKKQADELFENLGMNTSAFLNMFLTQSVRQQGIPFTSSINVPNKELVKALEEASDIEKDKVKAKHYKNFDEVLKDIS